MFALAGLRDIFVAYPVWAEGPKAERVRALHGTADLRVGVDSAGGAERLRSCREGHEPAAAGARRDRLRAPPDGRRRLRRPRSRSRAPRRAPAFMSRASSPTPAIATHRGVPARPRSTRSARSRPRPRHLRRTASRSRRSAPARRRRGRCPGPGASTRSVPGPTCSVIASRSRSAPWRRTRRRPSSSPRSCRRRVIASSLTLGPRH